MISVLVSYALDPIVSWFAKRRVPRALAAALVLLTVVGSVSAAAYSLRGEAATIVQQLPEAAQRLRTALRKDLQANGGGTIEQVQKAASELSRAANEVAASTPPPKGVQRVQIEEPAVKVSDYLWWSSAGIMAFAAQTVSLLFLVYFMLMSGDLFKRKLVQVTGPTLTKKKITVQILDEITGQIERFLFVQAFTSVLVALASWIAFRWVGLEQAGVWASWRACSTRSPISARWSSPAASPSSPSCSSGRSAWPSSWRHRAGHHQPRRLSPHAVADEPRGSMNAVAIFVGLLFWSWLWGVWGTLLAVPMLMVLKAVCDRSRI